MGCNTSKTKGNPPPQGDMAARDNPSQAADGTPSLVSPLPATESNTGAVAESSGGLSNGMALDDKTSAREAPVESEVSATSSPPTHVESVPSTKSPVPPPTVPCGELELTANNGEVGLAGPSAPVSYLSTVVRTPQSASSVSGHHFGPRPRHPGGVDHVQSSMAMPAPREVPILPPQQEACLPGSQHQRYRVASGSPYFVPSSSRGVAPCDVNRLVSHTNRSESQRSTSQQYCGGGGSMPRANRGSAYGASQTSSGNQFRNPQHGSSGPDSISVRGGSVFVDKAPRPHNERFRRESVGNSARLPVRSNSAHSVFLLSGPAEDFQADVVYRCFDEENGLLFRLVNNRYHTWAFYNDTTDMYMNVSVSFGRESQVQPVGSAELVEIDEENGACTIEVVVPPGATEPFMNGEYNGYRSHYEAIPVDDDDGDDYFEY